MPSGQPEVLRIGASDARHLSAADRFHVHVERAGADLRLSGLRYAEAAWAYRVP
jgi:hypothetical protein